MPDNKKKSRISLRKIGKNFKIGNKTNDGALLRIVSFFSGKEEKKEFRVLDDITFDVRAGEVVGIVGRNGSGKSTLLRLIAGIYQPDSGEVETEGKLVYLSGFGQGLRPKLTMTENIYLIASIMGLSRKEVAKRFSNIVEFSGLAEYVDTKVYQFSTGMLTRLNFSIGINCLEYHKPEILLIDEVLEAGGDIDFKKKAGKKIEEFIRGGAAVILVSHNLEDISRYCDRALLLEKGKITMRGDVEAVIKKYSE